VHKQSNFETRQFFDFSKVHISQLQKKIVDVKAKLTESEAQYEGMMVDLRQLKLVLG